MKIEDIINIQERLKKETIEILNKSKSKLIDIEILKEIIILYNNELKIRILDKKIENILINK